MSMLERTGLAALRQLDPETAHTVALRALRMRLAPLPRPSPRQVVRPGKEHHQVVGGLE